MLTSRPPSWRPSSTLLISRHRHLFNKQKRWKKRGTASFRVFKRIPNYSLREASRNRKVVTEAFLARFTLRDTEVNHLTSPSAEIDSLFFASMQRLEISVENCTDLLGFDSQRAGFVRLLISTSSVSYIETEPR